MSNTTHTPNLRPTRLAVALLAALGLLQLLLSVTLVEAAPLVVRLALTVSALVLLFGAAMAVVARGGAR